MFFYPATFPTRLAVLCTAYVSGMQASCKRDLALDKARSTTFTAITEPLSDRPAMLSQRRWPLSDQTSCWLNLRLITSM